MGAPNTDSLPNAAGWLNTEAEVVVVFPNELEPPNTFPALLVNADEPNGVGEPNIDDVVVVVPNPDDPKIEVVVGEPKMEVVVAGINTEDVLTGILKTFEVDVGIETNEKLDDVETAGNPEAEVVLGVVEVEVEITEANTVGVAVVTETVLNAVVVDVFTLENDPCCVWFPEAKIEVDVVVVAGGAENKDPCTEAVVTLKTEVVAVVGVLDVDLETAVEVLNKDPEVVVEVLNNGPEVVVKVPNNGPDVVAVGILNTDSEDVVLVGVPSKDPEVVVVPNIDPVEVVEVANSDPEDVVEIPNNEPEVVVVKGIAVVVAEEVNNEPEVVAAGVTNNDPEFVVEIPNNELEVVVAKVELAEVALTPLIINPPELNIEPPDIASLIVEVSFSDLTVTVPLVVTAGTIGAGWIDC